MPDSLLEKIKAAVHIEGEGIDEDKILAELAESYRAHGWPDEAPSYAFMPTEADSQGKASCDFWLYQLEHLDIAVSGEVRVSRGPLLGRLLDALKQPLHQLVLYYVNILAARCAAALLIQARLIRGLRDDVDRLKGDLARLEAHLARLDARDEK